MRALSCSQPWASCIAHEIKLIETRSWGTSHLGQIAIHASARPGLDGERALEEIITLKPSLFSRHVGNFEYLEAISYLPHGAVIATASVYDCRPTHTVRHALSDSELALGDYSDGRWAWLLHEIVVIEPIPCKGMLGLWKLPAEIEEQVRALA